MGFYCLIDNSDDLKRLDGWIASNLYQALKKREMYLGQLGHLYTTPSLAQLIDGTWYTGPHNHQLITRLPSLLRGWRAARKYYYTFGLEDVEPPNYIGYY